jgi:phenylalanyl-tRNA synthetase alpha chain
MFESEIEEIRLQFLQELRDVQSSQDIEEIKVRYLGKKGSVRALLDKVKTASEEKRPLFGKLINDLKEEIGQHCENTISRLLELEQEAKIQKERVDVTLPGRRQFSHSYHPITRVGNQLLDILNGMGFASQLAPNVESDYYNFVALNFPEDHPARDMQDTFYLTRDLLLRTHTTNTEIRLMEKFAPPLRAASFGRCFRSEDVSARSHVFFHQIEAIYIDVNVTFSDLLYTINEFYSRFFGRKIEARFRPSYFPFVEPGMEVDIRCTVCEGKGCRLCKHSGWLEVAGAGMLHPEVLRFGGIDPEVYSGFAWGGGVERLAMLRSGITDIRLFSENDSRFLEQFCCT